ncbi:MAG: hypothetical protein ACR2JJ_02150 [Sphingomicrobium sp.]
MRLPLNVSLLPLLLFACTVESGNQAENIEGADGNEFTGAPPGTAPPVTSPPQQPENDAKAPKPSGDVTLSATPASTTEGATITLTLSNGAKEQIGYNLCTSNLETSGGRDVPTSRVCTMELRTLEPGRTADYRYELPVNMVHGSYRIATQAEWMNSRRRSTVRSNSFEVR